MDDALAEAKTRFSKKFVPGQNLDIEPLIADQWVMISLLQKSIRRGEVATAQRAAFCGSPRPCLGASPEEPVRRTPDHECATSSLAGKGKNAAGCELTDRSACRRHEAERFADRTRNRGILRVGSRLEWRETRA